MNSHIDAWLGRFLFTFSLSSVCWFCMYPEDLPSKSFSVLRKKSESAASRSIVGLIVFDGEKFLLLHRVLNWVGWEYPKGGVEDGESIEEAIQRELLEETGIPKFEVLGKVDRKKFFDKVRNLNGVMDSYLVRVSSNNKINFDNQSIKGGKRVIEHDDYKWCFPKEAVELIKHRDGKESMRKAIKLLGLGNEK